MCVGADIASMRTAEPSARLIVAVLAKQGLSPPPLPEDSPPPPPPEDWHVSTLDADIDAPFPEKDAMYGLETQPLPIAVVSKHV